MEYELTGQCSIKRASLVISEAEFARITASQQRLLDVLRIEEKFGMLLENYREFELSLMERTLHHLIFMEPDYTTVVSDIYLVTRRLQNLLSTARLYVNQVRHDLSSMYGAESEQLAQFTRDVMAAYDDRLGFRVMEELRNFMQHRGLPTGHLTITSQWRESPTGNFAIHTLNPKLDVTALRTAGGFKKKILGELEAMGELLELKILVREYVEGLAAVHAALRDRLPGDLAASEAVVNEAILALKVHAGAEVSHPSAVSKADGRPVERYDLFDAPITRRRWLEQRNSQARHLTKHIASSEVG